MNLRDRIAWHFIRRAFARHAADLWPDPPAALIYRATDYTIDGATLIEMDDRGWELYQFGDTLAWRERGLARPYAAPADFKREHDGAEYAVIEDALRRMPENDRRAVVFRLWVTENDIS